MACCGIAPLIILDRLAAVKRTIMMNKLLIFLLKGILFFSLFFSSAFFIFAASADYGEGAYNSGLYGKEDPSTDTSTSSSSSTSSTGGGGTNQTASIGSSAQLWTSVSAGQTLSMKITKKDVALKKIEFDANKDLKNVEVTVNKLLEAPANAEISSEAYQFFEIKTRNIAEDDIGTITIRFDVTKSWMEATEISEEDVVLVHYKNSQWEELPTIIIQLDNQTDESLVTYESTAESFSYFAIAAKQSAIGAGALTNDTCTESWECIEWSECIDGEQIRSCLDKNSCTSPKSKPAESKDCSNLAEGLDIDIREPISLGSIFLWVLIITGAIVLGVGSYYAYQRYSEYVIGTAGNQGNFAGRNISNEHMEKLNDYITKCLSRGFGPQIIEKQLLSVGWPKDMVDKQIMEIMRSKK